MEVREKGVGGGKCIGRMEGSVWVSVREVGLDGVRFWFGCR